MKIKELTEGDVIPLRKSTIAPTPTRNSAWSDTHTLPPDLSSVSKRFDRIAQYGSSNVEPMHPEEEQPQEKPDHVKVGMNLLAKHGWEHVDTETYPSGQIHIYKTPTRFGSAHYLYLYPDGLYKYANQKGGPWALGEFLKQYDDGVKRFS